MFVANSDGTISTAATTPSRMTVRGSRPAFPFVRRSNVLSPLESGVICSVGFFRFSRRRGYARVEVGGQQFA